VHRVAPAARSQQPRRCDICAFSLQRPAHLMRRPKIALLGKPNRSLPLHAKKFLNQCFRTCLSSPSVISSYDNLNSPSPNNDLTFFPPFFKFSLPSFRHRFFLNGKSSFDDTQVYSVVLSLSLNICKVMMAFLKFQAKFEEDRHNFVKNETEAYDS
jgi:hypothetical protein